MKYFILNLFKSSQIKLLFLFSNIFFSCTLKQIVINGNETGRTTQLSSPKGDISELYAVTGIGLIFYSKDEGEHWEKLTKPFYATAIKALGAGVVIATAYEDSRVVNNGKGIWISRNQGKDWIKANVPIPLNLSGVASDFCGYGISNDPATNRKYVGTDYGIAYTDDLINWNHVSLNGQAVKIISVLALGEGKVIATSSISDNESAAWYSINNGETWTKSESIIEGNILRPQINVNKLAVTTFNNKIAFLISEESILYYTNNAGITWNRFPHSIDVKNNRPNFIRIVRSSDSEGDTQYEHNYLFLGNGVDLYRANIREALGLVPSSLHGFKKLNYDHSDPWDINGDDPRKFFLASDGGVHKSTDEGGNFTLIGSKSGLNALEIYEVKTQRITGLPQPMDDLYIGTQDNMLWAKQPIEGNVWKAVENEGWKIQLAQKVEDRSNSNSTFYHVGTPNKFADANFNYVTDWKNTERFRSMALLLKKGIYFQEADCADYTCIEFKISYDLGNTWEPFFTIPKDQHPTDGVFTITGDDDNIIIYYPIERKRIVEGIEKKFIGLKKIICRKEDNGKIIYLAQQDIMIDGNNGSLERKGVEFKWLHFYAVNPRNPWHIIAVDSFSESIKVSRDGGVTWVKDISLTNTITNEGEYNFAGQVWSIEFNPYNLEQILIGTLHRGIICSNDNGQTWEEERITKDIPLIYSIAFTGNKKALLASFGNGLWQLDLPKTTTEHNTAILPISSSTTNPIHRLILFGNKYEVPFQNTTEFLSNCTNCNLLTVDDGNIDSLDLTQKDQTGIIMKEMGKLNLYNENGKKYENFEKNLKFVQGKNSITTYLPLFHSSSNFIKTTLNQIIKSETTNDKEKQRNVKGLLMRENEIIGIISSTKNIIVEESIPKANPFLYVKNSKNGSLTIGQEVELFGNNFNANEALEIEFEGKKVQIKTENEGNFNIKLGLAYNLGLINIKIRQPSSNTEYTHSIIVHRKGD